MSPIETACLMRDAAAVKRYHTVRTLRQQTVGDHTFGTLMLLSQVYPEARKEVMLALIHHDLPELVVGDMPAPVKRQIPSLAVLLEEAERGTAPLYRDCGLTPFEEAVAKWCDIMELVLFALEELQMGNSYALSVLNNGLSYIEQMTMVRNHMIVGPRARALEEAVVRTVRKVQGAA